MDTRRLRHFLAVYDHGSMGQAAEALRLSQPALSKSIRGLERDLNVTLFERTPLGVVPTSFGEALALHARAIAAELRRAERAIAGLRGAPQGRVNVGIGPSMAPSLLPAVTLHLLEHAPGVRLAVREGLIDDLLPALRRGDIDVAIGSWPKPNDADLAAETLFADRICVLAGAGHPLAGRAVGLADLLEQPWVLPPESQRWRQRMNQVFLEQGLASPQPRVVSNCAAYIASLLHRGPYLTFLPMQVARGAGLVPLDCGLTLDTEVSTTVRARLQKSPALQTLLAALWTVVEADHPSASARPRNGTMPSLSTSRVKSHA